MSRPKILAIDDSSTDIELLRFALDRQGEEYELEVLRDGAEALEFIREHRTGTREPEPCVIVLDIHLPMHDGMEVLKAVRLEPALTHIQMGCVVLFCQHGEEGRG
jgi:CheY-like chemotaxis protein